MATFGFIVCVTALLYTSCAVVIGLWSGQVSGELKFSFWAPNRLYVVVALIPIVALWWALFGFVPLAITIS